MATEVTMITTIDNPFDPYTDFERWDAYDRQLGYNTTALIARLIQDSSELPEASRDRAYQDAVNEIVERNIPGVYIFAGKKPGERVG